jgi:uncharacterized protein YndB with AHSA1/START domain
MKRLVILGGLGVACGWLVRTRGSGSPYRFPTDVRDAAIIEADPQEVFTALIDEGDGRTSWWAPHHTMRLVEGDSSADVGAVVANTVMVRGRFPVDFTTRTTKVVPNEEIRIEYIDGAFRGTAQWRLEAKDGGTLLRLRWRTTPVGRLGALAAFLPIERSHSDSVVAGFENLRAHLGG